MQSPKTVIVTFKNSENNIVESKKRKSFFRNSGIQIIKELEHFVSSASVLSCYKCLLKRVELLEREKKRRKKKKNGTKPL